MNRHEFRDVPGHCKPSMQRRRWLAAVAPAVIALVGLVAMTIGADVDADVATAATTATLGGGSQ